METSMDVTRDREAAQAEERTLRAEQCAIIHDLEQMDAVRKAHFNRLPVIRKRLLELGQTLNSIEPMANRERLEASE